MDRRQRKLEQKRKKRELAKKKAKVAAALRPSLEERVLRAARHLPFGPCLVSKHWDDEGDAPEFVTLVITRSSAEGNLVPMMLLVDRTCLGIKNARLLEPSTLPELEERLQILSDAHEGLERCEPIVAQSIAFHALDYARALGFEAQGELDEAFIGPRPDELLPTPWHRRERPLFMWDAEDDVERVTAQLTRAVGEGNFDVINLYEAAVKYASVYTG